MRAVFSSVTTDVSTVMTEWVSQWKRNGWLTSQAKPVKNKDDIVQLDSACQKIDVKWVSKVLLLCNDECRMILPPSLPLSPSLPLPPSLHRPMCQVIVVWQAMKQQTSWPRLDHSNNSH